MKVYLAAPYSMKDTLAVHAEELRSRGIQVTSSWLNEPYKSTISPQDLPPEENQSYALQDVNDVVAANILVFYTDPTKTIVRAGRHVEFGMALACGRMGRPFPIFVVGKEHENIFHYMPQVYHFETWDAVRQRLCELAQTERA